MPFVRESLLNATGLVLKNVSSRSLNFVFGLGQYNQVSPLLESLGWFLVAAHELAIQRW